jgi:hypothetical protein
MERRPSDILNYVRELLKLEDFDFENVSKKRAEEREKH